MNAYLSVKEAAALLGLSKMTVHRMVNSGELAHRRIGRQIRIIAKDFYAKFPETLDTNNDL